MREYFTYGSVRGAAGDGGPYRVHMSSLRDWYFPRRFTERQTPPLRPLRLGVEIIPLLYKLGC